MDEVGSSNGLTMPKKEGFDVKCAKFAPARPPEIDGTAQA